MLLDVELLVLVTFWLTVEFTVEVEVFTLVLVLFEVEVAVEVLTLTLFEVLTLVFEFVFVAVDVVVFTFVFEFVLVAVEVEVLVFVFVFEFVLFVVVLFDVYRLLFSQYCDPFTQAVPDCWLDWALAFMDIPATKVMQNISAAHTIMLSCFLWSSSFIVNPEMTMALPNYP